MKNGRLALAVAAGSLFGVSATDSEAEMERNQDTSRAITGEVIVNAARSEAWEAFTTSEGATTFFAPEAHIELRLGGPYEIYFNPAADEGSRGSEGCEVLSYLPQRMLSFSWNAPPQFPEIRKQRTFVVVQLEDAGDRKTKVSLTHAGWGQGEQWDRVFAYFDQAWPRVLAHLQERFETGPRPWPAASSSPKQSSKPAAKQSFVYFIRPSRDGFFEQPTPAEEAAVSAHARYIKQLLDEGTVVLAGPCFDPAFYPTGSEHAIPLEMPTPGIVVFEADSLEQAKEIMEGDPAVQAGVFKARLNSIRLAFVRE